MPGDIIILHVHKKLWSDDVWFLRYGAQQTDGRMDEWTDRWTDEQKKWHIEVGPPPKNNIIRTKQYLDNKF